MSSVEKTYISDIICTVFNYFSTLTYNLYSKIQLEFDDWTGLNTYLVRVYM